MRMDGGRGSGRAGSLWALLALAGAAGCGGSLSSRPPTIELQSQPVALYDATSGKTTVIVEYLVRGGDGTPVNPADATVRRLVDGKPADVESVPNFTDQKLVSNLTLGMVLDASYSMLTWSPPALVPMEEAARDSQKSVASQFATWNAGTFTSTVTWFQDQYVCSPPSGTTLPPEAVLQIPQPVPGDATRLFAATAKAVDDLKSLHDTATPSATGRDQYALVVFTDGQDNYSFQDTSKAAQQIYPVTGGTFVCNGTAPTDLPGLVAKIEAFPELKVHVIGLGNQIKGSELSAIASAGGGRFVSNGDSGQVTALFDEITREFTTVRRDGITMPLQSGSYKYAEEVTVNGKKATAGFQFTVDAASGTATVDPGSIVYQ